ncbi:hypothetical protein A2Y83_04765 [Candidatus Falkowbacteria bacterium RBG_13_39_14]|uniref:DUF2283 domain-containing protein n=1 Tax=Candidatus Falkowbacteria bacterium RBG_13_39_14 TaxID=1797985 RepID=A0A1F5S1X2_9BACT|nr:MAG: hypothetical protein A2Y83_04765 [Candidatus Falkowbacteria bacterium RBG_13_39_14]
MKFHYDKKEDAFYLRFNENAYEESDEVKEGIILDYDKKGKIIGIEILAASQRLPRKFKSEVAKKKMSWQVA